jgi:ADP-heptose:LPS heptosyltransferase
VKLGALGDVLRTIACLEPLKKRYPNRHVTWVTRGSAAPLLDRAPGVDLILSVDSNYVELLLSEHFDLVIAPDADSLSGSIAALARSDAKIGLSKARNVR